MPVSKNTGSLLRRKKNAQYKVGGRVDIPSPKVMEVNGETLTHTTGLIVPRMTPKASETSHGLWSPLWTQTVEESKANWATEDTAGLLIISLIRPECLLFTITRWFLFFNFRDHLEPYPQVIAPISAQRSE